MKTKFVSALTTGFVILAATSSASLASMSASRNERPDGIARGVMAEQTEIVRADRIYSNKELSRSGYNADSKVEVTVFRSSGKIDKSSAGD